MFEYKIGTWPGSQINRNQKVANIIAGHQSIRFDQGIARTQSPTIKNYALKLPTFGAIVGVNHSEVQLNSLTLGVLPCWSQLAPEPGKYALAPKSI